MASRREPWNPFYGLVILTSLMFVVTVMGCLVAGLRRDRERARLDQAAVGPEQGPSETISGATVFFLEKGTTLLAYEAVAVVAAAVAAMGLDRWRSRRRGAAAHLSEAGAANSTADRSTASDEDHAS